MKHRLSFISLTIPEQTRKPQAIEGNKKLLAPFIRIMRKKHNMLTYIWKAEFQTNEMLHYHITTPSVIHYQYIKDTWNNLLSSQGLLDEHLAKFEGRFPNSTDIHSVYKKKDIVWYLSKEISKSVQDKTTTGKIWDCSLNLRGKKFYSTIEPSSFKKLIDEKKLLYMENCSILKTSDPLKYLNTQHKQQYNDWRLSMMDKGMY